MRRIVITDYPGVLHRNLEYEKNRILAALKDTEVEVVPFENREQWIRAVGNADALLTAFLPINDAVMEAVPNLQCIVLNASGYDNVDLDAATRRGIAVIPIEEYCTEEVAEHTMALILALSRGLKHYGKEIDEQYRWQYTSLQGLHRLKGQTLGIAGFGRIGRRVGKLADTFGMRILVYSPTGKTINKEAYSVQFVSAEEFFEKSDIITNHMAIGKEHYHFFNEEAFRKMKRCPLFINVGRGAAVEEAALLKALQNGWIRGAGLDVLESEMPELKKTGLTGWEQVILTPHSAFYSEESLRALQDISCDNLIYFFKGEWNKIHYIVNKIAQ